MDIIFDNEFFLSCPKKDAQRKKEEFFRDSLKKKYETRGNAKEKYLWELALFYGQPNSSKIEEYYAQMAPLLK